MATPMSEAPEQAFLEEFPTDETAVWSEQQLLNLVVDDNLPPLERSRTLLLSDVNIQRIVGIREFVDTARKVGLESTKSDIIPFLGELTQDVDTAVKEMLAVSIPEITEYFHTLGADGYTIILNTILPMVAEMMRDHLDDIRVVACGSLIRIAPLFTHHDLKHNILRLVQALCHDEETKRRISAPQLLGEIAHVFTPDLHDALCTEMAYLSEDYMFVVRKETALAIPKLCQVVGERLTVDRLLPVYLKLCKDDIWGVRKTSADSLSKMSGVVSMEVRLGSLAAQFEAFSVDVSRWVRIAVFHELGGFIATLKGAEISPRLVQHFTQMSQDNLKSNGAFPVSCAFNFPAVLDAIGKERWGEIAPTYRSLAKATPWRVRRTLSFSLHEIARILGPQITESELLPFFVLFLKDLEDVKIGIVSHLAEFLEQLPSTTRQRYLSRIPRIVEESEGWRFRRTVAKQLGPVCRMYPARMALDRIATIALSLCTDQVASVRHAACRSIPSIFTYFNEQAPDGELTAEARQLLENILQLPQSVSFERHISVVILHALVPVLPEAALVEHILPRLQQLQTDRVAVIRRRAAMCFACLGTRSELKGVSVIEEALASLKEDKDRDTRDAAHGTGEDRYADSEDEQAEYERKEDAEEKQRQRLIAKLHEEARRKESEDGDGGGGTPAPS